MGGSFEYCGYHFTPYRKLTEAESSFEKISKRLKSDPMMGMCTYKWRKVDYTWGGFYGASGDSECDLFMCEETGNVYIPCENELFIYKERKKRI